MTERIDVFAYLEADGTLVVEWEGERYEASNVFGLDSKLSEAGLPSPRNLHLVSKSSARVRNRS